MLSLLLPKLLNYTSPLETGQGRALSVDAIPASILDNISLGGLCKHMYNIFLSAPAFYVSTLSPIRQSSFFAFL